MPLAFLTPMAFPGLLRKAFGALPARVQALPVRMREIPETEWPHGNPHTGYWSGTEIQLRRPKTRQDYVSVSVHEVGHQAFAELLTAADRGAWIQFWRAHRSRMPTDYARTNALEGFAEVFEYAYRPDLAGKLDRELLARVQSFFR